MRWLLTFSIALLCLGAHAAHRIGVEASVTTSTSAQYEGMINFHPGNGDVVSNNPPTFSWFYNWATNLSGGDMNPGGTPKHPYFWTNAFNLQVASNSTFTGNLQVNVTTPVNFYNYLAPLDTNATRTFYWRVIYVRTNAYWTNGPFTFTVSSTATNWDRSMFTDANYFATNVVHPCFTFRDGEQPSILLWAQTNPASGYISITNFARATTNAAWWSDGAEWLTNTVVNQSDPNAYFDRCPYIASVLWLWTFSADNRWTNAAMTGWLVTNLSHYAKWFADPYDAMFAVDYGNAGTSPDAPLLLAAGYDWMYSYLGANTATFNGQTRTNLLRAINSCLIWQTHGGGLYMDSLDGSYRVYHPEMAYPYTEECTPEWSMTKMANSHPNISAFTQFPLAIVAQQDSAAGQFAFYWMMNYLMGKTDSYGGHAASHAGPYGYTYGETFKTTFGGGVVGALMHYDSVFPQAQLHRTEFARGFPSWWTRMQPHKNRNVHGPYGDGHSLGEYGDAGFLGAPDVGFALAAVTRSGVAMQAYNLNAAYHELPIASTAPEPYDLNLRWHYRVTPAPQTNSTSAVFPEDGYVIASSVSSSEFGGYTNAVGFSMRARPRGSIGGHDSYTDGSVNMWAYGAQITDGGGSGLNVYDYAPESSPTLFVNGVGQRGPDYNWTPVNPTYASITAFTNNGTNFVYTCADLKGLWQTPHNPLSNVVTKVKRHVLFPRSRYFVVYDEFGTTNAATFAFRWHIPWLWRYASGGSVIGTETAAGGDRFISNSLAITTNGFTYVAGNYTDSTYAGIDPDIPTRVPIHVMFVNATSQFGIFRATGTTSLDVSTLNANGTSDANSTLNPFLDGGHTFSMGNYPDRAVGMWVTNRTAATNFSLMTVIVPQQDGVAAPTFTRLADNAVAVTYGGVTETNVFGTNYDSAFTYMVELNAVANSDGGGGETPSTPAPVVLRGWKVIP